MSHGPRLNLEAAAAFLATVPSGCWTSYGDVAIAAGRSSNAGQPVSAWIGSKGHLLANVHRVLSKEGRVSPGWKPAGPKLPANVAEVEVKLRLEGVRFANGRADPQQRWQPHDAA